MNRSVDKKHEKCVAACAGSADEQVNLTFADLRLDRATHAVIVRVGS